MARAQRIKAKAKAHTIKVVVKSIGEAAESDLAYGVKAAGLVGKAALHDFAPILAPVLGPKFLPQLASVASVGPAGLTNVLGGLASAIGGQLLGNDQIGVAGPALLASRVASLLPADLLSGFTEGLSGVGGGLSPAATGLDGLIQNIPPEALQAIVGFFSGECDWPAGTLPWQRLPRVTSSSCCAHRSVPCSCRCKPTIESALTLSCLLLLAAALCSHSQVVARRPRPSASLSRSCPACCPTCPTP
jgi:hypothetical protein